jgi:hypothetical protein
VTLGQVILGAMLGNRPFQSVCSETVRLKTDGPCFRNVGRYFSLQTMQQKAVVALRARCSDMKGYERLLKVAP